MLVKTHVAFGVFATLFFLPHITYKLVFVPVVLLATLLPDIGQIIPGFRTILQTRVARSAVGPHGFLHSYTFCFAVTFLLAWYSPVFSLPFFLGYGIHLLADASTPEGIRPFWPSKSVSQGSIRVGGKREQALFIAFCLIDVALLVGMFV